MLDVGLDGLIVFPVFIGPVGTQRITYLVIRPCCS